MRKLTGDAIISEITLATSIEGGYIATTREGENCFVSSKVVSQNAMKSGDKLTGALVPHRWSQDCQWFAEWVVSSRMCTLEEVHEALAELNQGGAIRARDLGIHAGDILFHAGKAQKIVGFDRRLDVDAAMNIAYTIELDEVMNEICVEFDDGEDHR